MVATEGQTQVMIEHAQQADDLWNEKSSKIHAAIISTQHVELLKDPMRNEVVQYSVLEEASLSMEHVNKLKMIRTTLGAVTLETGKPALVSTDCGRSYGNAETSKSPPFKPCRRLEITGSAHWQGFRHRGQVCRVNRRLMSKSVEEQRDLVITGAALSLWW